MCYVMAWKLVQELCIFQLQVCSFTSAIFSGYFYCNGAEWDEGKNK
jgi:hypothetical protein